jgi:hypothetical protein
VIVLQRTDFMERLHEQFEKANPIEYVEDLVGRKFGQVVQLVSNTEKWVELLEKEIFNKKYYQEEIKDIKKELLEIYGTIYKYDTPEEMLKAVLVKNKKMEKRIILKNIKYWKEHGMFYRVVPQYIRLGDWKNVAKTWIQDAKKIGVGSYEIAFLAYQKVGFSQKKAALKVAKEIEKHIINAEQVPSEWTILLAYMYHYAGEVKKLQNLIVKHRIKAEKFKIPKKRKIIPKAKAKR